MLMLRSTNISAPASSKQPPKQQAEQKPKQ